MKKYLKRHEICLAMEKINVMNVTEYEYVFVKWQTNLKKLENN